MTATDLTVGNKALFDDKVSMKTKMTYGLGAFGKDFSLAVVNTFLFFYLTDIAKVPVVAVTAIFFAARIWDTINDPIWGYIVAKCNSRWGKYKPWIFIGNILNCVFMVACFATHLFDGTFQIVYLAIVYICWGMAYTCCDAPYWSMIPLISASKSEREGLLPYPRLAATIGGTLAQASGVTAVALFSTDNQGTGYMTYAAIGGVLAVISAFIACWGVEEKIQASGGEDFNIKDAFFIIRKNKQFVIFMSLAICYCIGTNLSGSLNLYIFKYVLEDEQLFSTMVATSGIVAIPCLVLFKFIINKLGRSLVFCIAIASPAVACSLLILAYYGILPHYFAGIAAGSFNGISTAIYWTLVFIMVADTIDYGYTQFKLRSESMYYSMHTLLCKCAGAVGGVFAGSALAMVGYVPDTAQTPETINALIWLYFSTSFLCVGGLLIYLFMYKLNGAKLDEVHDTLTRMQMDEIVKKAREDKTPVVIQENA